MDADLNKYDVEHVCTGHPKMSKQEWEAIYREAWSLYYTPEHMRTLLRRTAATGGPMRSLRQGVGHVRDDGSPRKRASASDGHPPPEASLGASARPPARKSPWIFWPRFAWETLYKHAILAGTIRQLLLSMMQTRHDSDARTYTDQALTPVRDDERDVRSPQPRRPEGAVRSPT